MTFKVGLSAWQAQFDKQAKATLDVCADIQKEAAKELIKRIQERTPIGRPELWKYPAPKGYSPGTLRASWEMEGEEFRSAQIITIYNTQPYAERVEYGWSTQAPYGMLRISLLEWSSIINKTKQRKF